MPGAAGTPAWESAGATRATSSPAGSATVGVPVPGPGDTSAADLIDWQTVVRLAVLFPPGPVVTRSARAGVVSVLRRSAQEAPAWVGEITGLRRAAGVVAAHTDVRVVDRAGLIRASAEHLRALMRSVPAPPAGQAARLGAGLELVGALGVVSTQLLGQVLPAITGPGITAPGGASPGAHSPAGSGAHQPAGAPIPATRLLLVAPNVLDMRRRLDLDLLDLPAWVALHETNHAVQLAAAPWLAEYLHTRMRELIHAVVTSVYGSDPSNQRDPARARRLRGMQLGAVLAGRGPGLAELLGRRERSVLGELAATMAFLEGHAEAVLDAVRPRQMPSVHRLRAVLSRTRADEAAVGPGPGLGSILQRLVSLDAKAAQYADGAAFVRAVVARVGHEGLNRVWLAPEYLPSASEIAQPDLWLERLS